MIVLIRLKWLQRGLFENSKIFKWTNVPRSTISSNISILLWDKSNTSNYGAPFVNILGSNFAIKLCERIKTDKFLTISKHFVVGSSFEC